MIDNTNQTKLEGMIEFVSNSNDTTRFDEYIQNKQYDTDSLEFDVRIIKHSNVAINIDLEIAETIKQYIYFAGCRYSILLIQFSDHIFSLKYILFSISLQFSNWI